MFLFQQAKIEIGIFEVGMGGRLDATNVLEAKLEILTPIYLDHEAFLGDTVAQITREKAAIIRRGADVVVSPQRKEAMKEIRRRVLKKKAHLWLVSPVRHIKLGLAGDYQRVNAGAALKAAQLLRDRYSYKISETAVAVGLRQSGWPGRFELFKGDPEFLLDGAHNPSSIEALVSHLKRSFSGRNRLLIFGTSRDKKSKPMLKTLSTFFSAVILTRIPNPRSQEISVLLSQSRGHFHRIFPASNISEALALARKLADPETLVVITGSFYLIGEARKIIRHA
jgi:dihydrofolate synthase/folylpolyglutamate synthase